MQSHRSNHALRTARKKRGLTQEELAEMLGVSSKTIGRWERGETRPGDYECRRLCQILQQSEEELGLTGVQEECSDVSDCTDESVNDVSDDPAERTNDVKLLLASMQRRNAALSLEPPPATERRSEVSPHSADSDSWQSLPSTKRLRSFSSSHPQETSTRTAPSLLSRRRMLQTGLIGGFALCSAGGLVWAASELSTIITPPSHQRVWPKAKYNLSKAVAIVRVLQWMLKARYYDLGPTGVDGIFGPYTLKALRSFEEVSHLPGHDYVDTATWEKLIIPSSSSTSGDPVIALQEQLNAHGAAPALTPDGVFGPETESALRSFQRSHKLASTSRADLDTWCVLVGGHCS